MMNKKNVGFVLLLSVTVVLSFGYLFYREVFANGPENSIVDECAPYNVHEAEVTKSTVVIKWNTNGTCIGYLEYSETIDGHGEVVLGKDRYIPSTEHEIAIDNLKPETLYYFLIHSDENIYGPDGKSYSIKTDSF